MAKRKRRTRAHVYADIAAKHFALIAANAGFTTSEGPLGADYGIDVTLYTFNANGLIDNEEVKVQIKASRRIKPLKGSAEFAFPIDKRDLDHWLAEVVPVILVRHDVAGGRSYWVYVQRYFESLPGFSLKSVKKTTTIRVPRANILDVAAMKTFRQYKSAVLKQSNRKISHV